MGNNLLLLLNEVCYDSDDLSFFKFIIRLNFNIFGIVLYKLNNKEEQFLWKVWKRWSLFWYVKAYAKLKTPSDMQFHRTNYRYTKSDWDSFKFYITETSLSAFCNDWFSRTASATNTTISIRGYGVVEMRAVTVKVFPKMQIAAMCRQSKPV